MLEKSIIDAGQSIQFLLRRSGLVDFGAMGRGKDEGGVELKLPLLASTGIHDDVVSFYRPKAKADRAGDPRIWPRAIRRIASAGDLLVLFSTVRGLVLALLGGDHAALVRSARNAAARLGLGVANVSSAATLLRDKALVIREKQWIPARGHGPRCVGETFEYEMGLTPNSYSRPDFLGEIEIKASRVSSRAGARGAGQKLQTLVSLIPEWEGGVRNSRELVEQYGYYDRKRERRALYCSIFSKPNPLGWSLDINITGGQIAVVHKKALVLNYSIERLVRALEAKHPATVFVNARARRQSGQEHFHYFAATYCEGFNAARFIDELVAGNACLDLTAHIKPDGSGRDHGYLWRAKRSVLLDLFLYRRSLFGEDVSPSAIS